MNRKVVALSQALKRSDKVTKEIWKILDGPIKTVGPISKPLLAYLGLGFEHHAAITLLTREGLFGSALALLRPVVEIVARHMASHVRDRRAGGRVLQE